MISSLRGRDHVRHAVKIRLSSVLAGPMLAISVCRAAYRDERNGFPFAAALEWRKAAELSTWMPLLAERCWREWERIMRLPRRLAEPLGLSR